MRTPHVSAPVLLAAALGLAACKTDDPAAPVAELLGAAVHHAAPTRPLMGTCAATGSEFVSILPPILNQTSTAVCQISLLGRVMILTQQHINVTTGVQTAEAVWTTASGDQLFATSLGTAVPTGATTIAFTGVTTLAGGTGRFVNAAGSVQVAGTVDMATGLGSFTYRGSLQFDGSNAANR